MPLETISCTHCGSSDVKEVKAGTYFCNHGDGVFRYVDPSKVTVQREFCECGKAVAVQCVGCSTGLCHEHSYIHQRFESGPTLWPWIPTSLPAYRPPTHPDDQYWVPVAVEPPTMGPHERAAGLVEGTVYCFDCYKPLRAQARALQAEEQAQHIARLVDAHAGDERAEGKVTGRVCAEPLCDARANVECCCCHLKWCGRNGDGYGDGHALAPGFNREMGPLHLKGFQGGFNSKGGLSFAFRVWVADRTPLCDRCWHEFIAIHAAVVKEMGLTGEIAQQLPYSVPDRPDRKWKRRWEPILRLREEVEQGTTPRSGAVHDERAGRWLLWLGDTPMIRSANKRKR